MTYVARWIRNLYHIRATILRARDSICVVLRIYCTQSNPFSFSFPLSLSLSWFRFLFFFLASAAARFRSFSPGIRPYLFSNTFTFTTRQLHLFAKTLRITDLLRFLLLWWCDFFHKKISFRLFLRYVVCALFPLVTVCLPSSVFNHKLITNFFCCNFFFLLKFFFFELSNCAIYFACVIIKKNFFFSKIKTKKQKIWTKSDCNNLKKKNHTCLIVCK